MSDQNEKNEGTDPIKRTSKTTTTSTSSTSSIPITSTAPTKTISPTISTQPADTLSAPKHTVVVHQTRLEEVKKLQPIRVADVLTTISEDIRSSNQNLETKQQSYNNFNVIASAYNLLYNRQFAGSMTTIKLNELVRKPAQFDGIRPSPMVWLDEYESSAELNGWSNETKLKYLPAFLEKGGYDWYRYEVKNLPGLDWTRAKTAFETTFCTDQNRMKLENEVKRRYQRYDEPSSSFISEMRAIVTQAYGELNEARQVNMVLERMNRQISAQIYVWAPTTFAKLRELAERAEQTRPQQSKTIAKVNRSNDKSSYYKKTQPKRPSDSQTNNYNNNNNNQNMSKIKCYNCNKMGHYSRDCRAPRKERKSNVNKISIPDAEQATATPSTSNVSESNISRVVTMKHNTLNAIMGSLRNDNSIRHPIELDNLPLNAFMDTGASVSAISEKCCLFNNLSIEPGSNESLSSADGKSLTTLGTYYAKLSMTAEGVTKTADVKLVVIRDLGAEVIIGQDLCKPLKILLDCASQSVIFKEEDKSPNEQINNQMYKKLYDNKHESSKTKNRSGPVTVTERQTVPAASETWIKAIVNTNDDVFIKGFATNEMDLLVGHTLDTPLDNAVHILILNPHKVGIQIEPGQRIGTWESLTSDDTIMAIVEAETESGKSQIEIGDTLSGNQVNDIIDLIRKFHTVFSFDGRVGKTSLGNHVIELLPDAKAFIDPLRRRSEKENVEVEKQISDMLKADIIEPSMSSWASAYVLIRKPDGSIRFCIDFRRLNKQTKVWCYPLPRCDDILDKTAGKKYYSKLDLNSGYWQVPVEEKSKQFTAFRCQYGQYQFKRMPFGLVNAGATFQRLMNSVIQSLHSLQVLVYLDDIIIFSDNWQDHLTQLTSVLAAFQKAKLTVKPNKCIIGASKLKFLGHVVSCDGMTPDPDKVRALRELPQPYDAKTLKSFLGAASYYRRFIPNFATICSPLTSLTKKETQFVWETSQKEAFAEIKRKLINTSVSNFDNQIGCTLKTDASYTGIGGILLQNDKIITCVSRCLSQQEKNYSVTELEALALVWSVTKLRPYIIGSTTVVLVDHCALCALALKQPLPGRLARWAVLLSEFQLDIRYVNGKTHHEADCLSRLPSVEDFDWEQRAIVPICLIMPTNMNEWIKHYDNDHEAQSLLEQIGNDTDLSVNNNLIYYKQKLFVPTVYRKEKLNTAHNSPMAGHGGVKATLANLNDNYWWPTIKEDVTNYVKECNSCQKYKRSKLTFGELHPFNITQPFELWALDFIGPITTSTEGHTQILVAIDHFTKLIETMACSKRNSATVAQFIVRNIYCKYGPPQSILVDNAGEMVSRTITDTCKILGIEHVRCTPYHSRGNACVERVNRTITQKLALATEGDVEAEQKWPEILPLITFSINKTVHTSTGFSPFELTYGYQPVSNDDTTNNTTIHDVFARDLKLKLHRTNAEALSTSKEHQAYSKQRFDKARSPNSFCVGDRVMVEEKLARSGKLRPLFKGPFEIVELLPNDVFKCRDLNLYRKRGYKDSRFSILKCHVERLKPFYEEVNSDDTEIYDTNSYTTTSLSYIGLILTTILATIVVTEASIWQEESPIIWRHTDKIPIQGTRYVTVDLMIKSPCSGLAGLTNDIDFQTLLIERCERDFKKSVAIPFNRWAANGTNSLNKINKRSVDITREERQVFALGAALGSVAYWAVTSLVESNSGQYSRPENIAANIRTNHDNIDLLQSELVKLVKHKHTMTTLIEKNALAIKAIERETTHNSEDIKKLLKLIPETAWASATMFDAIHEKGILVQEIVQEWNAGHVSNKLGLLANISELSEIDPEMTDVIEINSLGNKAVSIVFQLLIKDTDSTILKADGFQVWSNLTTTPCRVKYAGATFVEYNHKKNCSIGLGEQIDRFVPSSCARNNFAVGIDTWSPNHCVDSIKDVQPIQEYKITRHATYVYCFKDNITILNATHRCPPYVFKIDRQKNFNTTTLIYSTKYNLYKHEDTLNTVIEEQTTFHTGPRAFTVETALDAITTLQELNTRNKAINMKNNLKSMEITHTLSFWERIERDISIIYYLAMAITVIVMLSIAYRCTRRVIPRKPKRFTKIEEHAMESVPPPNPQRIVLSLD